MQIKIGCCLSLTGSFALQGRQAEKGLRLWAEDVNAAGGLPVGDRGDVRPLDLIVRDDASHASKAAQLAEELILADHVDLFVGPYGSATTLAVAEVAEAHRTVLWNHGGSTDAVVECGFRYVVSVLAPASRYFVGLLDLIRTQSPNLSRVFLAFGPAGTFARSVIDGAEVHARGLGLNVIGKAPYPANADFAVLAAKISAQQPDILLGAGRLEADIALAQALRDCTTAPHVIGLVAAGVAEFGARLGLSADGFYGPSQWESVGLQPDFGPTATEFAARFRTRFGTTPEYPAAQTYAAGLIVQRCVALAGTLDANALRQVANTLTCRTLYGDFQLDPATGEQVGHAMVVVQWQTGARQVVWPPGRDALLPYGIANGRFATRAQ